MAEGAAGWWPWLRRALLLGLGAALAALWLHSHFRVPVTPAQRAPVATPIEMRDAEGTTFTLGDLRGRVVLVNLWASWCGPCRTESARLARLHRELAADGVEIIGLNADELSGADLRRVGREWGIPYRLASPLSGLGETTFRGRGVVPHTWLVDRQGRVRVSRAGLVAEGALRRACRLLIEETPDDRTSSRSAS